MLLLLPVLFLFQNQPAVSPSPVVSTQWLADHLRDSSISVIDTGSRARYAQSHIKGARHLDHEATLGADHRLAPPAELAKALVRAGGGDGRRVVIYGDDPMVIGWIYMAFTSVGRGDDVLMLDGNLALWNKEGRAVDTVEPAAATGTLTPKTTDAIVDANYVRARLEQPATMCLIDARTTREVANGKLPGSTLVLWQDLYADQATGRLKSPGEIRTMFVNAGYKPGAEVVTYCAIGMRASLMFFAARYAGLPAKVYVGSWSDWSQRPGFPIVR